MIGTKILTTMVLAVGLAICLASLAWTAPMGTAYTYQGWLIWEAMIARQHTV